ncbi:MAG: hypothetical protein KatS3mg085_658 [Candidatus Dojkabacteria bacterium]|nr:MAG: hypothetical protein KatS3mg085_658 [Candidatus Dojkabacteria bacterium]
MNKKLLRILKNNDSKFLLVDKELQELITKLSQTMNTNAHDVVKTALKILDKSIGKKVIIRDTNAKIDEEITAFENINKI